MKHFWLYAKILMISCCLSIGTAANAHHSVPVNFDMESDIVVTGTLTAIKWVNPHSHLEMNVVNDDGENETWLVEWNAVNTIKRLAKKLDFSMDDFVIGDTISVGGFKGRQGNTVYFRRATLGSGKKIAWQTRITRGSGGETAAPEAAAEVEVTPVDFGEATSGSYTNDPGHTYITFNYDHQGYSRPYLRFRKVDATLELDTETPANSKVSVDVAANSIDSGIDVFDQHLNGEKFFDSANYPNITFESTSLEQGADGTGTMTGDLTLKGQTHPITLDVTFNRSAKNRQGVDTLGFSARGMLKRSDWGMSTAVPFVSDEVNLLIEAEFAKSE